MGHTPTRSGVTCDGQVASLQAHRVRIIKIFRYFYTYNMQLNKHQTSCLKLFRKWMLSGSISARTV